MNFKNIILSVGMVTITLGGLMKSGGAEFVPDADPTLRDAIGNAEGKLVFTTESGDTLATFDPRNIDGKQLPNVAQEIAGDLATAGIRGSVVKEGEIQVSGCTSYNIKKLTDQPGMTSFKR